MYVIVFVLICGMGVDILSKNGTCIAYLDLVF